MANYSTHKTVAVLPASPEPDSVYFVRTGSGVKQYVTDGAGNVQPMMVPQRLHFSTRLTLVNGRWVGPDDVRGYFNENWKENYGTGAAPNYVLKDAGPIIPAGAVLKRFEFRGRYSGGNLAMVLNMHAQLNPIVGSVVPVIDDPLTMAGNSQYEQVVSLDVAVPNSSAFQLAFRAAGDAGTNRTVYLHMCLQYDIPVTL